MQTGASKSRVNETRQRLLEAAARVFAKSGLEGATTREIAKEAGVNEVTLFRHFQSRENLLGAVLQSTFSHEEEAPDKGGDTRKSEDFRAGLRLYMQRYAALLQRNMALLRTLLGEIHRYSEHEASVLKGIFAPLKADLRATIQSARTRGIVRDEIDPLIAADLLGSMIFVEVLRRSSPFAAEYSPEVYLDAVLDVFVRGVEKQPPSKGNSRQS